MAVTLQDGNDWADHQALYEYGFSTYPSQRLATLGQQLQEAAVQGGAVSTVPLIAADTVSWPTAKGERVETRIELEQPLTAPLTAGNRVGQAVFTWKGQEIGRVGPGYAVGTWPPR